MDGGDVGDDRWMCDRDSGPRLPDHMYYIARHMRALDAVEAFATRFDSNDEMGCFALTREWYTACRHIWVFGRGPRPVALVAANQMWPHHWGVGMITTDEWPAVALTVTRFVKRSIVPLLVQEGAWRVQAASHATHDVAHRWLRFLGAEHEATLRRFGRDGADYLIFCWHRAAS